MLWYDATKCTKLHFEGYGGYGLTGYGYGHGVSLQDFITYNIKAVKISYPHKIAPNHPNDRMTSTSSLIMITCDYTVRFFHGAPL